METNWILLLPVAALCGLVAHHGAFIRGEWHLAAPRVVIFHFVLAFLLWITTAIKCESIVTASQIYLLLLASYLGGLFSSIATYRLFFHKLSSFPGPRWAALTKFWHVYKCQSLQNYQVLHDAYVQYGEFVRTGPNEITIYKPSAIELFEKSNCGRSEWYDVLHPKTSPVFERDEVEHMQRRRLWNQAMSIKSINNYLPRILRQVDTLAALVESYGSKPVLINDVMAWFSFDSMGEFMFNEGFGMMTSSTWHPAVLQQRRALSLLGLISESVWIARLGFAFAPFYGVVRDWLEMVEFCDQQMKQRIKSQSETRKDIAAWFISEFYQLAPTKTLQQRKDILSGNTVTAIVAGSDTTRPSLIAVWYYLAMYPKHASKVHEELEGVDTSDLHILANLRHMNGFINESMRLCPAAMTGASRYTPPDGLWIDNTWIPGGTKVAAPRYSILRLPTAFKEPETFIPERWYSKPEYIHDRRAFAPFGAGNRSCVGKNLALSEIRLVTARLLKQFEVRFAPGFDPDSVLRTMTDEVTAQPGKCWLAFTPRDRKSAK